jgi:hypothetical protein
MIYKNSKKVTTLIYEPEIFSVISLYCINFFYRFSTIKTPKAMLETNKNQKVEVQPIAW